ncbi:hypothetical protein KIN20_003854 [Parelaphostrongylus tenuis]|uniref:Uncharacterized protein n=1 Tax=Parelaphostrongylus tenuis TaxID=148309 RepID=A0AAD5MGC8_PARTN|nr:hypothetical protein KIN20_003854 [Parelaphostrongylus tenuis]
MSPEVLIFVTVLGTASSLSCQCSSEAGGIPCYNGWCNVQDFGGKVGACALVRIGVRQHFACVRVKPTSKDSCRVTRRRNGEQQVQCWCRENYCNTDLADRVDEDHDDHENMVDLAEKLQTTTIATDTMNDDFVIERNYDLKDQEYLNEYQNEEALGNDNEDHPPTLPPTRIMARTTQPNRILTTTIPPWRREYPVDRNQIQSNWLISSPLSPLPTQPDPQRVLPQSAAEQRKRIMEQQDHLRRIELERKTQPIIPSTSTTRATTTTITTISTTSTPPFVYPKESVLADERSPFRHEDSAMVYDRRLYDEQEARRRHEELFRREQQIIVERARAQAEARSRLFKQNVTKPRAWLQVGLVDAQPTDSRRAPPILTLRNYRPFDLNSIRSDIGDRSTTTVETVSRPLTTLSESESQHEIQNSMVMTYNDSKGEAANETNTTSSTTTARATTTLTSTTTKATPSPTSSFAIMEKTTLKSTASVMLSATTATMKSITQTDLQLSTTTTTASTSPTYATTTIMLVDYSNFERVLIPTRDMTKVFRQKVPKNMLHESSIASNSTVFVTVIIIVFVSFLS